MVTKYQMISYLAEEMCIRDSYAISAFAEETKETEESKPEESTEQTPGESETDVSTCLLYTSSSLFSPQDADRRTASVRCASIFFRFSSRSLSLIHI